MLDVQYRMTPAISAFPRANFIKVDCATAAMCAQ